jgi:hypothetical protein
MIKIYAEKEIFEEILLFDYQFPNLNQIFTKHAEVFLNITSVELEKEECEGSVVFEFIKLTGGRSPVALKEYFEDVYKNNEIIADKPRSVFFLNCSETEAKKMQEDYGVIVQSKESINDNMLSDGFYVELQKNEEYCDSLFQGWKGLFRFGLPPINSIVIIDNYLLLETTKVNGVNVYYGKDNLVDLIDAILPDKLQTCFHLTIISEEDKKNRQELKKKIEEEINKKVSKLRCFEILLEIKWIPIGTGFHKRRMVGNYINATCDKGFAFFKNINGKHTVVDDNDFRLNRVFFNLINNNGNTDFESVSKALNKTKKILNNSGQETQNRLVRFL